MIKKLHPSQFVSQLYKIRSKTIKQYNHDDTAHLHALEKQIRSSKLVTQSIDTKKLTNTKLTKHKT